MNAETISCTIIGSQPGPIHSRRTRMDGPQMGSFLSLKMFTHNDFFDFEFEREVITDLFIYIWINFHETADFEAIKKG